MDESVHDVRIGVGERKALSKKTTELDGFKVRFKCVNDPVVGSRSCFTDTEAGRILCQPELTGPETRPSPRGPVPRRPRAARLPRQPTSRKSASQLSGTITVARPWRFRDLVYEIVGAGTRWWRER